MSELDRKAAQSERFEDYLIFHGFTGGYNTALDFVVVECCGDQTGLDPGPLYVRNVDGSNEMTRDPADADVFLEGDIKWDGCSNWDFPGVADCMLHFCDLKQASGIGRLMQRMYEIASMRIPSFDFDLAGMKQPNIVDVAAERAPLMIEK